MKIKGSFETEELCKDHIKQLMEFDDTFGAL